MIWPWAALEGEACSHIGYCMDDFKSWWCSPPFSTSAMLSAFAFSSFTVSTRPAFSLSCCRLHEQPFFFFFTLVTGPRRALSLKLSDTRVYEPEIFQAHRHGQPPHLGPNHGAAGHLGGFLWMGRQLQSLPLVLWCFLLNPHCRPR